jgi:predicted DCC family thiol-disulfide oxidoreductase YuxK
MLTDKKIVLFDGVCNLCSSTVQFIIKRDKKNQFLFASLQSVQASELLKKYSYDESELNSFVLIDDSKIYTHSSAVLRVLKHLSFIWSVCYIFIILPKFIRDGVYNYIAKHRYKWFGKKEECWVPTPDLQSKFLDYDK